MNSAEKWILFDQENPEQMRLYPDKRIEVSIRLSAAVPEDQRQQAVSILTEAYSRDYYACILERVN